MKMKTQLWFAAGVLALGAGTAFAADGHSMQETTPSAAASAGNMAMIAGEVRKVDADQGKVTLKHDAITNLDMPAMTMVFRAQSPELLKNLKPGDKVRFHAESSDGGIVVTHIQPAS